MLKPNAAIDSRSLRRTIGQTGSHDVLAGVTPGFLEEFRIQPVGQSGAQDADAGTGYHIVEIVAVVIDSQVSGCGGYRIAGIAYLTENFMALTKMPIVAYDMARMMVLSLKPCWPSSRVRSRTYAATMGEYCM